MGYLVDSSIRCGNACDVQVSVDADIVEVSFAPDPHGGPECMWFCFRLVPVAPTQARQVRLVLKNVQNMLGGNQPGNIRPVVRPAGSDWRRLDAPSVIELPDGRYNAAWMLEAPQRPLDVALCYPYDLTDLHALLRRMQGRLLGDVIGVSQKARPILRLSNSYGNAGDSRPGIYVVARQHAGETPGSWVLDGFLEHIATLGPQAPLVWAVPLADIDGVEEGNYGKDHFPYDLNRAWGNPPMRHEVLVIKRDIERWKKRCRPVLGIDLHAPGACEAEGIYAYVPDPRCLPGIHQQTTRWTQHAAEVLTGRFAAPDFARVAEYPSRWESPHFTGCFWSQHELPAFALETPYALTGGGVLSREDYQEAGRRLAVGICRALAAL